MFENRAIADLAVGRSTVRQRILALLLAEPGTRLHLREIQRRVGTSPGTASRELTKLVSAGLIEREAEGSQVYFRGSASPFATLLRSLLMTAPTPAPSSAASPGAGTRTAPPPRVVTTPPAPEGHAAAAPAETASEVRREPVADMAITSGGGRTKDSTTAAQRLAMAGGAPLTAKADPFRLDAGATFVAQISAIYGERLRGVYLYGPRASGGVPPDSDVDLLVVLDRVERYGEELDRTGTVCASLSLKLGVIVSRVFVSEADWQDRMDGQLPGIRTEAVPL